MSYRTTRLQPEGEASSAEGTVRDVPAILAGNLKRLRKGNGYSLDKLAELSNVSRAMLGQIETGKSVPTISVLWKIADALRVSITSLLALDAVPSLRVFRRDQTAVYSSPEGHFRRRALFQGGIRRSFDFFEISIAAGHTEQLDAAPHSGDHYLVVAEGRMLVAVGEEPPVQLDRGDAVVFQADMSTHLINESDAAAIAFSVVSLTI